MSQILARKRNWSGKVREKSGNFIGHGGWIRCEWKHMEWGGVGGGENIMRKTFKKGFSWIFFVINKRLRFETIICPCLRIFATEITETHLKVILPDVP